MAVEAAPGIKEFLIQVYGEQRETLLNYAVANGHGVDVSDFISLNILDDTTYTREIVGWYRSRLPDICGTITLHAALWDLIPSARDNRIRTATMERIDRCLDIAEELNINQVVCHLDFNALAHEPTYPIQWAERHGVFWREVFHGRPVAVLLENTLEPRPEVCRMAVDAAGLDCIGVCLDAAHVHLNSTYSQSEWVNELGPRLRLLHISDNDRSRSQHLPPGQGTIDWIELFGAVVAQGLSLPAVIEVGGIDGAQATVEYLSELKIN